MEQFLSNGKAEKVDAEGLRHKAVEELRRFLEIRSQVFDLMAEADRLAGIIRQKAAS